MVGVFDGFGVRVKNGRVAIAVDVGTRVAVFVIVDIFGKDTFSAGGVQAEKSKRMRNK
jgi:hypothetical protein